MPAVTAPVPNPFTPMAFLPPDVAYESTIMAYVAVGSLSALIWDILTNLKTDYQMISRGSIRLPLVTYIVSRLGTLGCILGIAIMRTAPIGDCSHLWGLQILYVFSIPPSLLLFFFRIRALYFNNRYVQIFFFTMWLAVLGVDSLPAVAASAGYLGNTNYCINGRPPSYIFAVCTVHLVNDVLVFLATSWKLMQMTHTEQNVRNGVRVMLFGDYLPAFSRSILKDGQLYFLTTIGLNLVTNVLFFIPSVPLGYRSLTGVPCTVLMNSMSCYVFRKIQPGVHKETTASSVTVSAGQQERLANPISALVFKDLETRARSPDLGSTITHLNQDNMSTDSVLIWDIFDNLKSDYLLLSNYRIASPTVVYFLSRLGTLSYALVGVILRVTAPISDCTRFENILTGLYSVAVPTTALLFFLRVRAVFDRNKYIVTFFAFMWLAVLAGSITVTQGLTGMNIGTTDYCANLSLEGYVVAAAIIPLVNDTLVFLAISFRLMSNTQRETTLKGGVRTLLFGTYLPSFSKAFLQDGQLYYLTTVATRLLTVILFYSTNLPAAYRSMFILPNIVIMNIMACRVFRNTKFGHIKQEPYNGISTTIRFRSRDEGTATSAIPLSLAGNLGTRIGDHSIVGDMDTNAIYITKIVEDSADGSTTRDSLRSYEMA
ncbi:hypothetical protein CVT26_013635 [Gymnopilus dilepis]|uniref:Uncharacterized protein n=1 Tax=Gymnopilus dilepis TaxID=231916 RepID=A0A409Y5K8_9AGAR|nr:hypothetical protein CVT26_013635 [Gymnopilus dilepis]